MIDPFSIATDGIMGCPLAIATSGYLTCAVVQDSYGSQRRIYYENEADLKRQMKDDEEIVMILSAAHQLGII